MKQALTATDFNKLLKSDMSGGFLFFGEEEYMKHYYLRQVRKRILGDEDSDSIFRHKKISCIDFSYEKILDAVYSSPMPLFGDSQEHGKTLCELHELQLNSMKDSEWKALLSAMSEIENNPDIVLVLYTLSDEFDSGNPPKNPSSKYTKLAQILTPVHFQKESDSKLIKWIEKHFTSENLSPQNNVALSMLERCGRDMFVLSNEIKKLCSYLKHLKKSEVTLEDVEFICSQNIESEAFDFSNALMEKNTKRAYALLYDMKNRHEKPFIILANIIKVFSDLYSIKMLSDEGKTKKEIASKLKMNEYKVGIYQRHSSNRTSNKMKKIIEQCCDADIKIKSSAMDGYTILDNLVMLCCGK